MARMKTRRLSWKASASPQVVGYKLYWSEAGEVNYDSPSVQLGNVTSVILPNDVPTFKPGKGPIDIGLTAVDELGNESDMITISAPYQFSVPEAPGGLRIDTVSDPGATPPRAVNAAPTPAEPDPAGTSSESGATAVKNIFTEDSSIRQLKSL